VHGDKLCDVALTHFRDRSEGREFTLAIVELIRTLGELTALDLIESQFSYIPPARSATGRVESSSSTNPDATHD
jgi:hypothetical protein